VPSLLTGPVLQAVFGVSQAPPDGGTLTLRCPDGSEFSVTCVAATAVSKATGQQRATLFRVGRLRAVALALGADVGDVLAFRNLSPGVASLQLLAHDSQAS
jgi:hypothetical protein